MSPNEKSQSHVSGLRDCEKPAPSQLPRIGLGHRLQFHLLIRVLVFIFCSSEAYTLRKISKGNFLNGTQQNTSGRLPENTNAATK